MPDRPRKPFRPGHYQTPQTPSDSERPKHAERDRYDWITLWTAIVGVTLVCIGTGVTAYQAIVMREELDSALHQQRPWVRVDVVPYDWLEVDERGLRLPVKLVLTNSGNLPAIGVWTDVTVQMHKPLPDKLPNIERGSFCDGGVYPGTGRTVFPGETVTIEALAEVDRERLDALKLDVAALTLRACAIYYGGASDETRHTDRTIIIHRGHTPSPPDFGFSTTSDRVLVKDLRLRTPLSGNVAD